MVVVVVKMAVLGFSFLLVRGPLGVWVLVVVRIFLRVDVVPSGKISRDGGREGWQKGEE